MSSAYVAVNNGYSTLAAGITTSSQTTITLAAGEGARFPSPTGGNYTLVTVENAARVVEIVSVVGRSTDTLTVGIAGSAAANSAGRGMEGTTATTWLTGDVVECRATAAIITIGANASALAGSAAQAFSMTTATQGTNTTQGASTAFVINEFGKHKNLIIGGDFTTNPWQRGTTFTALGNGSYGADRFFSHLTTAGVVDVLKSADAPTAAAAGVYAVSCLTLDVTTVDASIAAGDYYITTQNIEGLNSLSLGFGQAGTRYCTLSFWHKHTKTGTYCIGVTNSANDRSYVAEYTQDVTNTWEKATLTIPVDTSGTWLYTSGIGVAVRFAVVAGSTFQTTANTWAAGNYLATSNQVNALDSTSNFCKFALIQLEAGSVATQFETRSAGEELALCQRYYEKSYPQGTAVRTNATNLGLPFFYASAVIATGSNVGYVGFKVTKRDTPTITTYSYTSSTSGALSTAGGTDLAASSATTTGIGDNGFSVRNTSGGNITPATGGFIVHWAASIEL